MHQPLRFTPRVAMPVVLTLPVFVTTALMWGENEPFEDERSTLWRTRIALGSTIILSTLAQVPQCKDISFRLFLLMHIASRRADGTGGGTAQPV